MIRHKNFVTYHLELSPRLADLLEELREQHPDYTEDQLLVAAIAVGLDWLSRDEKAAYDLKKFYPPRDTASLFPLVALRVLAGKVPVEFRRPPPRFYPGHACR